MFRRLESTVLALAIIAVVACGGGGRAAVGASLYSVTSTAMQVPGSEPQACFAMPLPLPPIGCGGVELRGLEMGRLPGVVRYSNGVTETRDAFQFVGTWDGQALTLMRPPSAASQDQASRIPECAQEPGQSAGGPMPPLMQRVIDDQALLKSKGIQLLEFYPCTGSVFLGLVVADQQSIDFLTGRYGEVEIGGWLQPVS